MRFVFSVAFKYLIPRLRQLSVSIISLVSILVISLVVWLVIVFLSVTDGIEKNWIKQLVALNAPLRIIPTEAYYKSYYYQIDQISSLSNYTTKTIGEKLESASTDPYDPSADQEIPAEFPLPDRYPNGTLRDIAKEADEAIHSLTTQFPSLKSQEYEVSFGNLRLGLLRDNEKSGDLSQTFLSQVSYIASFDKSNPQIEKLILAPTTEDLNNLLFCLGCSVTPMQDDFRREGTYETQSEKVRHNLTAFFHNVDIHTLKTADPGFNLPRSLFPENGSLKGCAIVRGGSIAKVMIPSSVDGIETLQKSLTSIGHTPIVGEVHFGEGRPVFVPQVETDVEIPKRIDFVLEPHISLKARLIEESLERATTLSALQFDVETEIQGISLQGIVRYDRLEIGEATLRQGSETTSPLWIHKDHKGQTAIPIDVPMGDGILVAKQYKESGVRLGDTGFLSYFSRAASGVQEQRLPIYVAGFYDPGFMPAGNKLVLVDPKVTALLRGNVSLSDHMLGNGVHIWMAHLEDAHKVKAALQKAFKERGIEPYWKVESYMDYDFARPVLQQLESDKTLFTLIAVIILIVACSNIISMLILLVNDKKREIGILQSMGASSMRIASIFGVCGFITGLLSSCIGIGAAMFTLKNLQSLVDFLSFVQGHQAFHTAFYGDMLPNELSMGALVFVLIATTVISLFAGISPAIKAAKIRPSEILRSE